jgi:predicted nucleic acid-binding protein
MKVYWDTSALVRFYRDRRIREIKGVTRTHSLTELFSAFTGRGIDVRMQDGSVKHKRLSMRLAASIIKQIHARLEFVDLTHVEVLAAIQEARTTGAQGGRIHDLMHAAAAEKANADEIWTLDRNDFAGLGRVLVRQLEP